MVSSWDKTYSHTLALAFDRLGAAAIFNQADITISSLCWVVLATAGLEGSGTDRLVATRAFFKLKLSRWQLWTLRKIGAGLEHFWPGHCAAARLGDLSTSSRMRELLSGP